MVDDGDPWRNANRPNRQKNLRARRFQKIPAIPGQILEHPYGSVRFLPRLLAEPYSPLEHRLVVGREIGRLEKQKTRPAALTAYRSLLIGCRGLGQQDVRIRILGATTTRRFPGANSRSSTTANPRPRV